MKVESNIWRADTTKNVLRGNRMEQPPRYMASNSAYSDSPRMARWNTETEKLEKALAEGKPLAAYTAELKKMGYQIDRRLEPVPWTCCFRISRPRRRHAASRLRGSARRPSVRGARGRSAPSTARSGG